MKTILKLPTKTNAGIAIENDTVYHFLYGKWLPCGDCKITDEVIQDLIKEKI